jgi:hypothetical protein
VKKELAIRYRFTVSFTKIYIAYKEELYADSLNKSRNEEPAAESSKKPFHEK